MWYSVDSGLPVRVSFNLNLGPFEPIHETQIATHAADVNELKKLLRHLTIYVDSLGVDFDGSISIELYGEELLGPDYWIEFVNGRQIGNLMLSGLDGLLLNNTERSRCEVIR